MCGPTGRESLPFREECVDDFYKLPIVFPLPPLLFLFFKTVEAPEEKEEKKVIGACYPHHYVDPPPISISFLLCATTNLTPAQQFSS